MKPSRGLKTPLAIICRSERVLASRGTRGSPRASLTSSPLSSPGALRSTRVPPCGAMVLLSASICLLSEIHVLRLADLAGCGSGRAMDGVGGELVVVGQAVLVRLLSLVGEGGSLRSARLMPVLCCAASCHPSQLSHLRTSLDFHDSASGSKAMPR